MTTGRHWLEALRVPSDRLAVGGDGVLAIDGHRVVELIERFGSPLYVTTELTLRENYRRLRRAFVARWAAPVNVMYALKTNNTLALRAVLSAEGAGGDCFGLGELYATLAGGADPQRVVINGSDKRADEIAAALARDIAINIDGEEEIDLVACTARASGRRARVNLRLKPLPAELDAFDATFFKTGGGTREAIRRQKWGFTIERAGALLERILARAELAFTGYSVHLGRFSNAPAAYALTARALGEAVARLHAETGAWPRLVDLGGGWARQREPESRASELNRFTIEDYAQAATDALRAALGEGGPLPELWLEPGRYIVGNATLLLARVGAIKRDDGLVWVHVDASTNDLMRIETSRSWYHLLPASRMDAPFAERVDIVGGTCIPSVLGAERDMPALARGDVVAILDAGMYAEAIANQFNGIPRPAHVLIGPVGPELIRRRETIADVLATHEMPARLAAHADAALLARRSLGV
jgi:diaminopimelate decarboxylase